MLAWKRWDLVAIRLENVLVCVKIAVVHEPRTARTSEVNKIHDITTTLTSSWTTRPLFFNISLATTNHYRWSLKEQETTSKLNNQTNYWVDNQILHPECLYYIIVYYIYIYIDTQRERERKKAAAAHYFLSAAQNIARCLSKDHSQIIFRAHTCHKHLLSVLLTFASSELA